MFIKLTSASVQMALRSLRSLVSFHCSWKRSIARRCGPLKPILATSGGGEASDELSESDSMVVDRCKEEN